MLLARGLATGPKLVILDEPTRGIDVGAKQEIMSLIREIALKGIGVIFISSDLSEVVSICDRVTVIKEGKNRRGANRWGYYPETYYGLNRGQPDAGRRDGS